MKNVIKMGAVSLLLAVAVFAYLHRGQIQDVIYPDKKKAYCQKFKDCIFSAADMGQCIKRIEEVIGYGYITEEQFIGCVACLGQNTCSQLIEGACAVECDMPNY